MRGALPPVQHDHFASIIEPARVGELLRAMDGYTGTYVVRCALRIAPLLFVRPGELRKAEWSEFDLDSATWSIPAVRMKMREAHIVPLSTQAGKSQQELEPLTGRSRFAFPSVRSGARPMSENTINAALRRLGYAKPMR